MATIISAFHLLKSLAPKVLNLCHSERSEESVLFPCESGFFVISLPKMTFEATSLLKRYGEENVAVAGIDFSVQAEECFGFLGPNGAGKTAELMPYPRE